MKNSSERVIEIARDNKVKMLWGEVLAANLPMLGLVKKLGFTIKATEEGVRSVEMSLVVD